MRPNQNENQLLAGQKKLKVLPVTVLSISIGVKQDRGTKKQRMECKPAGENNLPAFMTKHGCTLPVSLRMIWVNFQHSI